MKAKNGFVLRKVVDEQILMPVGDNIGQFNGTVLMNDVSAFVWEKLQEPVTKEELLQAVLSEFEVDEETASRDLDELLEKFAGLGIIEE
ncbi:MAG: PqqD family protein [Oscillospiraceae bacterium]|nr:PqqD family protein [Oscillospiraceae bacterium]